MQFCYSPSSSLALPVFLSTGSGDKGTSHPGLDMVSAFSRAYERLAAGTLEATPEHNQVNSIGRLICTVPPVDDLLGNTCNSKDDVGRFVWDDTAGRSIYEVYSIDDLDVNIVKTEPVIGLFSPTEQPAPTSHRPFNPEQAARQKAAMDEALADSKKRTATFAWPAKKGQSSDQSKRQALKSLERGMQRANQGPNLPPAARPAELNRFKGIHVPELSPDEFLTADPMQNNISSTYDMKQDGSRVDENRHSIDWPWDPSSKKTRSQAPPAPPHTSRHIRMHHPIDDKINMFLDAASADGKRGRTTTGVRAWFAFCEDVVGTPADRPVDPFTTPLFDKLEDEWLAMRFVCALVEERGVTPDTAAKYFSSVQGWHLREHGVKLAGGMKLERIPQMVKGMKRLLGSVPKKLRRGVAPQALKKAMDLLLDPKNPTHANIRAALACALQGLLRSAEYTSKDGKSNRFTITRADIAELTDERLVFWMHPCKNMNHIGGKTCPLVIGAGGLHVDAVAEVRNLLEVDPIDPRDAHLTPLFRDPLTNTPLRYDTINNSIKKLMESIGENPDEFSTHSMRIGGATALFAAGANETVIRTMGRWSSDMHRLYVRACFEQCCEWTRRAGTQSVSDLAGMTFDEVDDY